MSEPNRGRLLILDDEVELMRALCESLADEGFATQGFGRPADALDALRAGDFDLLLSDLMMPEMDGIGVLRQALEVDPHLVGIIMTGQGTIPTAVEAMKAGAFDYVLKPFRLQAMLPILDRAMGVRRLKMENVRLRAYLDRLTFESAKYRLVGTSPAIRKVVAMIEKVAPTDATVLVRGASGSGKELVARALHYNSPRRGKPLVTVNCATLQESLLESELFGHEKGAFTGADKSKSGLFEVADGGTLFVDEVAEMSPGLQAKLLRVLESGHYRRVGGTVELTADVRIVAATNKPLEEEQKAGRFREDLYYRLNVITIPLAALRDRREDIPLLVEHLLSTRQVGKTPFTVGPDALARLAAYDWPGNVRELANVLERAQILAEGSVITADDLPDTVTGTPPAAGPTRNPAAAFDLEAVERKHVADVLAKMKGNKVQAAKALGISRRALYRLIDKYALAPKAEPAPAESEPQSKG
jgi:DNA-binding NtrC family response regulator